MIFFKTNHTKQGFVYAITKGTYLGELFVFIETNNNTHLFLSLPDMKIRSVPKDKFKFGLDNKIIDIVQRLPKKVYNICKLQFNKNIISQFNPGTAIECSK